MYSAYPASQGPIFSQSNFQYPPAIQNNQFQVKNPSSHPQSYHGTPVNSQYQSQRQTQINTQYQSQHQTPVNSQYQSQHQTPVNSQYPSQHQTPVNSQYPSQHQTPVNSHHPSQHQTPVNSQYPSQHQTPRNSQNQSQLNNPQNYNTVGKTIYSTQLPQQQTQIIVPTSDPQPVLNAVSPSVVLKSTKLLNSGRSQNYVYDNPMTYSTLENLVPRLDELDSKKINKDFDFNTHYDIEFKKEQNIFPYTGIRKINLPLFGHLELPQEYNYTSPSLSPDGRYLACVARGADDIAFIWETNNLYCFKFKYSSLRIDGLAFTPDSSSIIIVYRFTNPVIYNLANGEKIRSLAKNGEENNRAGFQYSFTQEGKHFGYTSDQSFTVWSMTTGLQRRKIKNNAPIKLICGEYLICISDDLICSFIKHRDGISDYEFKIRGVYSIDEILDCRVTIDMKYFIYVLEQGIIKYHINTGEFQGLQKFKPMDGKIKAVISPDCRYVVKTNMKYLNLYNLETQETIGTVLKDPFNEFKLDFENKKIITINDICINIHDYSKEKLPEKFVWLNKNPTHFIDIKFSKDFKILIGQIDNNNTVVYDCETGKVIRKFQNFEEDYSISCEVAPTTIANLTNISSKSVKNSISIFNYLNGTEDNTFYGFNAYSFCFSDEGSLLAVGAKNGPEIARLYNINSGQYVSFEYNGSNYNFHTVVNISSPKSDKLICCSIDQQPLIFDIRGELIFKCECKYHFEEIYEIESDSIFNIFLVKGRDTQKRNIAILYRLSDGIIIERYENYTAMNLALCRGYLVGKCENFCNNRLSTMCLHNINRPVRKVCQLQSDDYYFLNDYKGFVSKFGGDENIIYYIANVENGRVIAKVNYAKKSSRNAETHISVDPTRNELVFRYIELLPFEDTLFYRKQHIDKVNKDDFEEEDKINFGNNDNENGYEHNEEMGGNDDEQGGFDNQNNNFEQNENENDGF